MLGVAKFTFINKDKNDKPEENVFRKSKTFTPDVDPAEAAAKIAEEQDKLIGEAVARSKRLLDRSASQETLNRVFGYDPKNPLKALSSDTGDILGGLLKDEKDLISVPLGNMAGSDRFSREQVGKLCGSLGDTPETMGVHAALLGRTFYLQFKGHVSCDARVQIGEETVIAHRIVLAAFSDVFSKYYGETQPNKLSKLEQQLREIKCDPKILARSISWMYTGRAKLGKNAKEFRALAERLGMKAFLKYIGVVIAAGGDSKKIKEQPSDEGVELNTDQLAKLVDKDSSLRLGQKSSHARLIGDLTDLIEKEQNEEKTNKNSPDVIGTSITLVHHEPEDLYRLTAGPSFLESKLSVSAEQVFHLLNSDDIVVKTELDVYTAALKWMKHDFEHRKQYLQQLMDCPRWVYMTNDDMIRVRTVDARFFHHEEVVQQVSKAKWYQDLKARGVEWTAYRVPKNRVEENDG